MIVEFRDGRAVSDRDDRRVRQSLLQRAIEICLRLRVEARGRFVEKQPIGLGEKRAGEGDTLLLATGKALRPVLVIVQVRNETGQAGILKRLRLACFVESGGRRGIGDRRDARCRAGCRAVVAETGSAPSAAPPGPSQTARYRRSPGTEWICPSRTGPSPRPTRQGRNLRSAFRSRLAPFGRVQRRGRAARPLGAGVGQPDALRAAAARAATIARWNVVRRSTVARQEASEE